MRPGGKAPEDMQDWSCCLAGALEEGLSRAAEEMQAGFAEVREEIAGSSDKAENRLDHLQRSQVYLEQKLLGEIQTKEAALESLIQQTGNRGQEDVQALAQAMEANAQQISRLRSQFASDYNRFGENTTLMQEQLQSVGQSLDAQHANITKAGSDYFTPGSPDQLVAPILFSLRHVMSAPDFLRPVVSTWPTSLWLPDQFKLNGLLDRCKQKI